MRAFRSLVAPTAVLLMLPASAVAGSYLYTMDELPSLQGAVYGGTAANEGGTMEIINGQLVVDTMEETSDVSSRYRVVDPWDTTRDATLTFKARLEDWSVTPPVAAQVILTASSGLTVDLILQEDRVLYFDGNGFVEFSPPALLDATEFHTYKIEIPANTNHFDLKVDGQWITSAEAPTVVGSTAQLLIGDGTSSGGNVRMRFKEVRLVNWGFLNL